MSASSATQRLTVFPVWELHFTKRGDEVHRIATERVKWSAKYQRKYGIKTRGSETAGGRGGAGSSTCASASIAHST